MLIFLVLLFGYMPTQYAEAVEIAEPDKTEILRLGEKNPVVQYAYDLGGLDFVLTVERESKFDINALGDHGTSKWFCQWHNQPAVWNDPNFKDPYWQVEKCLWTYSTYMANKQMYKLSGYKVRNTVRERFTFN